MCGPVACSQQNCPSGCREKELHVRKDEWLGKRANKWRHLLRKFVNDSNNYLDQWDVCDCLEKAIQRCVSCMQNILIKRMPTHTLKATCSTCGSVASVILCRDGNDHDPRLCERMSNIAGHSNERTPGKWQKFIRQHFCALLHIFCVRCVGLTALWERNRCVCDFNCAIFPVSVEETHVRGGVVRKSKGSAKFAHIEQGCRWVAWRRCSPLRQLLIERFVFCFSCATVCLRLQSRTNKRKLVAICAPRTQDGWLCNDQETHLHVDPLGLASPASRGPKKMSARPGPL